MDTDLKCRCAEEATGVPPQETFSTEVNPRVPAVGAGLGQMPWDLGDSWRVRRGCGHSCICSRKPSLPGCRRAPTNRLQHPVSLPPASLTPSPSRLPPAVASGLWMGRQAADITCPPRAKESTRISFPLKKTTTTFIRPGSTSPQNVREENIPASPTDTAPSPALGFRLMISKCVLWKYMVPMLGHRGPRQRPGVLCCQSTCRGGFVSGMQDTGISSLLSLRVDPELAP